MAIPRNCGNHMAKIKPSALSRGLIVYYIRVDILTRSCEAGSKVQDQCDCLFGFARCADDQALVIAQGLNPGLDIGGRIAKA